MDPEKLFSRVMNYYLAYYAEIRVQSPKYASLPEAIPDFLQDYGRRIIIDVCRDGVIITHYTANDLPDGLPEVFQCYGGNYHQGIKVKDQMTDLIPGLDYASDGRWNVMLANLQLHEGSDITGPVVWEAPWKRIDAVGDTVVSKWGEELGRAQAKSDVLTFANAHLMGLRQGELQETRDRVIIELEAAIREFRSLLDAEPDEEKVQLYLSIDRNKILLEPSALSITPKIKLGSEYVTDFVIELSQRQYILVEIEKPEHTLFTKQGRVTAKVTDAQQQVEDWINWIRDYPPYAQNSMPGVSEPQGWVILGRRESLSESDRRTLAGRNANHQRISIMTFDDLLDRAKQHLENLRKLSKGT